MTRRHALFAVSVASLAAFGAVLFWFRIGSGDVKDYGFASGDIFLYFYPSYEQIYARIRGGVLPRWNPWQLFGTPWLATLQPGLYYPGHLTYLVLPTHVAMAVSGYAHLVLAAVGVYAFLTMAGLGTLGGLAGAIVFAFRGYFLTCLSGPNLEEAAAWIGVGALGVLSVVDRRDPRSGLLLAAAGALSLLAGAPQHTAYLVYAWATLWLARTIAVRRPLAAATRSAVLFGAAMVLSLVMAAAQVLPTAEVMAIGSRSTTELPERVLSPIGNPAGAVLFDFPIIGLPHSFGIVPLVLAGVAAIRGRHLWLLAWAAILGLASAVFALGTGTRWFWIYRALPGLGMFRGPERVLLLTDFALAVAAAVAVDGLVRGPSVAGDRHRRVAFAVTILGVTAAWTMRHVVHGTPGAALLALALVAATLAWSSVRGKRIAIGAGAAVVALIAAEVFVRTDLGLVFPYTADKVRWAQSLDPTYRYFALNQPHDRIWLLQMLDPQFAAKQATRHGLRDIEDYEPMNLLRQNRYLTFLGQGEPIDFVNDLPFIGSVPGGIGPAVNGSTAGERRRLLDLGAVGRILVPAAKLRQPAVARFLAAAGLTVSEGAGPMSVVRNPHAIPRAYVVYRTAAAPPIDELLRRLADPAFDPLALAYVEGDLGLTPATDPPTPGSSARFLEDSEDIVEVEATASAPALLVLSDTYFTGWHATVDGAAAPILPTNYLFRGVPVPAGTHRVRFVYRPWTIPAGQAVSLAGLVVVAVLLLRRRPLGAVPIETA